MKEYKVVPGYIKVHDCYRDFIKRVLSILLALMFIPILLAITIIIAPIIKLSDKGSVFYISDRLGRNGNVFRMYKFRSMKMNAGILLDKDGISTIKNHDPRVTKVGRIIRKTGIDELPQIINIIKGEMSFIGPRPDLPDAVEIFSGKANNPISNITPNGFFEDYYRVRMSVRPGMTCYGPVVLPEDTDRIKRSIVDAWYAQNISFKLDTIIVLKTIKHMISGKHK